MKAGEVAESRAMTTLAPSRATGPPRMFTMTSRFMLATFVALTLSPATAQEAAVPLPAAAVGATACDAYPDTPGACAARAEVDAAARCALSALSVASAGEDEPMPDPGRIGSDRREALAMLGEGDVEGALLVAAGTRAMAGSACAGQAQATAR